MPVGIGTALTGILGTVGVSAATADILGTVGGTALFGAGTGALVGAATGGNVGKDALLGGITGGFLGGAPAIGAELGIGTTAADVLLGAAGGAAGGALTGGNVGKDALFGGLAGGVQAALTPSTPSLGGDTKAALGASPAAPGSVGAPAGGGTAAATAANLAPVDLTAPLSAAQSQITGNLAATGEPAATFAGGPLTGTLTGNTAGSTASALGAGSAAAGSAAAPKAAADAGGVGSFISKNPGAVVGALGLGYEALTQPKVPSVSSTTNALEGQAQQLSSSATALESSIFTGRLPPGAQTAVDSATRSAKASIRSQYAAMGISGSTSEATALAEVDRQAAGQVFQIADTLLQDGIKQSGISADIYKSILDQANQQQTIMSSAISNFAASLAGGGKGGVTINTGAGV